VSVSGKMDALAPFAKHAAARATMTVIPLDGVLLCDICLKDEHDVDASAVLDLFLGWS
jgi:hypothetical protein